MKYKFITIVLILALATLACGFSFSLPKAPTPGPDVTDNITVPLRPPGRHVLLSSLARVS